MSGLVKYWVEANDLLNKKGDETHKINWAEHAKYVAVFDAEDVARVLHNAKFIATQIVEYGMQTESQELDLTTAEFNEVWRVAKRLLAEVEEKG